MSSPAASESSDSDDCGWYGDLEDGYDNDVPMRPSANEIPGAMALDHADTESDTPCYPSLPLGLEPHEFRLLRIHPGRYDMPIECALWIDNLDRRPHYEALSYTWGVSSTRHRIEINSRPYFVTDNCFRAIRRLRNATNPRVIWVDAICIDQTSTDERGHQVSFMADIYKGAAKVLIWLGDVTSIRTEPQAMLRREFYADYSQWQIEDQELRSLAEALANTEPHWWDRVWVVQEYVVANKGPIFFWGPFTGSLDRLRGLVRKLRALHPALLNKRVANDSLERLKDGWASEVTKPEDISVINMWAKTFARCDITLVTHLFALVGDLYSTGSSSICDFGNRLEDFERLRGSYKSPSGISMQDAMTTTAALRARDSVDKVFSLIGILPAKISRRIHVSYHHSPEEVSCRATYAWMLALGAKSVLSTLTPAKRSNVGQQKLSSWAVDFGDRSRQIHKQVDELGDSIDVFSTVVNIKGMKTWPVVDTAVVDDPSLTLSLDAGLLQIPGFYADRIHAVCQPPEGMKSYNATEFQAEWHDLYDAGRHDMCKMLHFARQLHGKGLAETGVSTIVNDISSELAGGHKFLQPACTDCPKLMTIIRESCWESSSEGYRYLRNTERLDLGMRRWLEYSNRVGCSSSSDFVGFCTKKGLLGLALHGVQPNDIVCVLRPGNNAIILGALNPYSTFKGFTYIPMMTNLDLELPERTFTLV